VTVKNDANKIALTGGRSDRFSN